jgi:DNA-binding response OmpR family regulator
MEARDIKLLVVEDDDAIREGIIDLLTLEGFEVTESRNGQEALSILSDWEPDLVISDVMMPKMDGHKLLQNYRMMSNSNEVPFLFLTALTDKTEQRKGMNLGADDYLTKPFTRQELLDAIHTQYQKYNDRKNSFQQKVIDQFEETNRLNEKEKETMVMEIHHRVKHNLAVISAFFELGEMSNDPEFMHNIKHRVRAMASIHEEAYDNELICKVDTQKLITNVLDKLFDNEDFRFIPQLEKFDVSIDKAIPLGLLLYEFFTLLLNKKQIKESCRVHVTSYKLVDKACMNVFLSCDASVELDDVSDSVELLLIHSFISQLKCTYSQEYHENGTMYTFEFPFN